MSEKTENDGDISSRRHVVLDGSNIIWGGSGENNSPDINRLFSAIAFYEELDYSVISVMSRKQWDAIRFREKEVAKRINSELRQHGKLQLADEDDILVIHLALKNNAWLITQDTFQDKIDKKTKEVTKKRERSLNPELDWDDIDSRTRGTKKSNRGRITSGHHWNVEGSDFFDPTMPRAPPSYLFSEYENIRKMSREVRHLLDNIHTELDELELEDEEIPLMDRYVGQALNKILALESIIPDLRIPPRDQLEGLTVVKLKEICRNQGLAVSGNKGDLIERLSTKENEKVEEQTSLIKSSTKTKNGSFTKKEFIEELFAGRTSDKPVQFAELYNKLIQREPKFNLKQQSIKPSVYIQGCSNLIEIEIRKNAGCTYYFIKRITT